MMTRTTLRAGALTCALLTSTALSAPALAQNAPPQKFSSIDENGVDLTTGNLFWSMTEGSIGSGAGALSMMRYWAGPAGWRDNWTGAMYTRTENGVPVTYVELGSIADTFTSSGGTFTSIKANGGTLAAGQYTASDGTKISFVTAGPDNGYPLKGPGSCQLGSDGTCSVPASVQLPNGMKFTLGYDLIERCASYDPDLNCLNGATYFRLRTVTSSGNYKLTINYRTDNADAGSSVPPTNWYIRSNVQFTNLSSAPGTLPTITYGYNASNVINSVTDTGGRVWGITVGPQGPTAIRRPGASADTTTISYSPTAGTVSSVTNEGVSKSYARSVSGSTATMTVTDALNAQTIVTSDLSLGRATSVKDPLNRTTSYQYDSNGRLVRTTAPDGNYAQLTYDARGNVTEQRAVAKAGSGLADIVSSASYGASCVNVVTCNKPTSTTDARGSVTDYTYDAVHGGLASVTLPAPASGGARPQTRFTYSQLTAATGEPVYQLTATSACQTQASCAGTADEVKSTTTYNTTNLLPVSSSAGDGTGALMATSAFTYDPIGNLIALDGPLAGASDTTKFRYNTARQQIGMTGPDPDGTGPLKMRATRNTYVNGLLTKVEQGTVSSQSDADWAAFAPLENVDIGYDDNAREVSRRLASSGTTYSLTQQSYDALGRLQCTATRMNPAAFTSLPSSACSLGTQGSFGQDRITKQAFDASGRLVERRTAFGTTDEAVERAMSYTNNGQIASLTDGENNRTSYAYDGFDRLILTQYPNPSKGSADSNSTDNEAISYDANDNIVSQRNRAGESAVYAYDLLNRRTSKILPNNEPSVSYSYNLLGRLTAASQPGYVVTFTYDALGRTITETGPLGTAATSYDLAGARISLALPGGAITISYDRDQVGELIAVRENGATSGLGLLATYNYDDLGRRVRTDRGNGTSTSYAFDAISRLTSMSHDLAGSANDLTIGSVTYNPAGQILSQSKSNDLYSWLGHGNGSQTNIVNGLNQLTGIGGQSVTNDARGNVTSEPLSGKSYGYSSENLLTSASPNITMTYDPLRRLASVGGTSNTLFGYSGEAAVIESDNAGVVLRRYVPGDVVDEPVVWYEGAGSADRRWYHADERGSIIAISDSSGAALNINRFDEFGRPSSTNLGRYQFTGQKWIAEVGSYDFKTRNFSPSLGRFLQSDTIRYGAGLNLYNYVKNDPVNGVDPNGTCETTIGNVTYTWHFANGSEGCSDPSSGALQRGIDAYLNRPADVYVVGGSNPSAGARQGPQTSVDVTVTVVGRRPPQPVVSIPQVSSVGMPMAPLAFASGPSTSPRGPVSRPQADWCGSDRTAGVPDRLGKVDITGPCYFHDQCYDASGTPRSQCDKALMQGILEECKRQSGSFGCYLGAVIYYYGLRAFGGPAYKP